MALLCGLFALNGIAAGNAAFGMEVDSCVTHTAALSGGDLYMWGSNDHGQFPESQVNYSVEPIKTVSGVKAVAVADNRTLVLYENGDLYAYGLDPITGDADLEKKIDSGVVQADCGKDFALYVTNTGALMGWGSNDGGRLGLGDAVLQSRPAVILKEGVQKTSAGMDFALVLKTDGTLWGFGSNVYSQLNYLDENGNVPETVSTPVQIADQVKDMDAGDAFTCVLKQNGDLYTCGMNSFSQTGTLTVEDSVPLTKIMGSVASVSAGSTHCFAVKEDGTVYSWGYGVSGQLGNTTGHRQVGATEADYSTRFKQIYTGADSTFGVADDGSLWAWGANANRLLATASGDDAFTPVKVLNADMSWAFNEAEEEPGNQGAAGSGSGTPVEEEPTVVRTPFVDGNGDGTYSPNKNVTRAEFLKMAVSALTDFDKTKDYGKTGFSDVDESRWFAPYISYAKQKGIVSGDKEGNTFRPNGFITRAEAAKIAAAAMGITSTDVKTSSFNDVTGWAVPYVEALAEKKILEGDKGTGAFRPTANLTRAEAAKVVGAAGFDPKDEAVKAQIEAATNPFTDVEKTEWYYSYILFAHGDVTVETAKAE